MLRQQQSGQVLVIGLIVCIALTLVSLSVANVGMMVAEKIHVQNTVDAAAYSAAVTEARYMNLTAYLNRAMVANYSAIAFGNALWASTAAYDHGLADVAATMYEVSAIAAATLILAGFAPSIDRAADVVHSVHDKFHDLNRQLDGWLSQEGEKNFGGWVERYNTDVLSMYGGLLYAAQQSARYRVITQVAKQMDGEVKTTTLLGLGSDVASFDELQSAIEYVVQEPGRGESRVAPFGDLNSIFKQITSPGPQNEDAPYLLGAVSEASLDKFSTGYDRDGQPDTLRQFDAGNIIPHKKWIERVLNGACELSSVFLDDCNAHVDLKFGSMIREGQEDFAEEEHVPIIARKRLRQVQEFGMRTRLSGISLFGLDLDGPADVVLGHILGHQGYTSAEKHADVANSANVTLSATDALRLARAQWGRGGGEELVDLVSRFVESVRAGSRPALPPITLPVDGLNKINMAQGMMMGMIPPVVVDDHWDGTFGVKPVNMFEIIPPGAGLDDALNYFRSVVGEAVDDIGDIAEGTATATEMGVPKYDYRVNLHHVGFSNYHYPSANAERRPGGTSGGGMNNFLSGPTIAAMGVKKARDINGLQIASIGNQYAISAMSAAQVYYTRNPNRPDEQPNIFNPHWVARLRPIDSADVPDLIRYGLPYLGSVGLPVVPTH